MSTAPGAASLEVTDRLPPAAVAEVRALLTAALAADGVRPVSEESELRLQHGGPPGGTDVTARDADGELVGYARLELPAGEPEAEAELVVAPTARRAGTGTALLARLEQLAGGRPLRVWAHGELPGSAELARARGYDRARVLLQMRRPLAGVDPDPQPSLPDGVTVATFRPGTDEDAWLRVNARAFVHHPEQGRWTRADLTLREAEEWFDPAGFFLAWRGDQLLGSHWTKVHPAGEVGDDPVGEVYVLGIDPDAQGMRLGRALTDLGLAHLRARGLAEVLLYVEEDNTAAVSLYERSGFTRYTVDVSWRRAPAR
ncbi:mycothiol synthase [Modestobacter versicolor]|uniref:mycothiol synthase n=1 Tax=Modestobacter versicolor TaxID=429133 RepID=UPI0034DF71E8